MKKKCKNVMNDQKLKPFERVNLLMKNKKDNITEEEFNNILKRARKDYTGKDKITIKL